MVDLLLTDPPPLVSTPYPEVGTGYLYLFHSIYCHVIGDLLLIDPLIVSTPYLQIVTGYLYLTHFYLNHIDAAVYWVQLFGMILCFYFPVQSVIRLDV